MSKYRWRSITAELKAGATDGKYRKERPNTSVQAANDRPTLGDKSTLHPDFGYSTGHEAPVKWLPDGTQA